MATWIVGDVHGCFRTFQALMRQCGFQESGDRLLLVGDLVNGGPGSLQMLRWCRDRSQLVESVLGNHDLYLLGRWSGACRRKKRDTLDPLLEAPDADGLLEWLRRRPLTVTRTDHRIVHAGLLPAWTWAEAVNIGWKIEARLRGSRLRPFLHAYFEGGRDFSRGGASKKSARLAALRALTMIRTCSPAGSVCEEFKGPPEEAPKGFRPWYEFPEKWAGAPIYFGHWAACGFRRLQHAVCLDSGCVWGNALSAVRLDDGAVVHQENLEIAPDSLEP